MIRMWSELGEMFVFFKERVHLPVVTLGCWYWYWTLHWTWKPVLPYLPPPSWSRWLNTDWMIQIEMKKIRNLGEWKDNILISNDRWFSGTWTWGGFSMSTLMNVTAVWIVISTDRWELRRCKWPVRWLTCWGRINVFKKMGFIPDDKANFSVFPPLWASPLQVQLGKHSSEGHRLQLAL
jgi:hypothetical protein